jgi:outer membrane lipoprotein
MKYTRLIYCIALFFLAGCASDVPILIKLPPEQELNYEQVKNNTKTYQGQYVRWGGKIISVENKEDSTWIEIMANSLNNYGRPTSKENYEGRFIARIDGFLDPEQYAKDKNLTVYGKVESKIVRQIDDHPYDYPLVSALEYHLWPENRTVEYPYYYDHHFYPYYYYPHHRHH